MGIISSILNLFSSGIFGSISGIVSHYIASKNKLELTRLKYKNDLDMVKANTDYLNAQVAAGVKIQQTKTEGDIALADEGLKQVVYKQAGKRLFDKSYMQYLPTFLKGVIAFMFANVDVLRTIIRPVMTLVFSATFIFIFVKSYLHSPQSYILSATLLVDFIIYIVAAVISFYYMARDFDKHVDKLFSNNTPLSHPIGQWYEDTTAEKNMTEQQKK